MVRTKHVDARALRLAAVIVLPLIATGCATPRTQLEWGTQKGPTVAKVVPKPRPECPYTDSSRCTQTAAAATPRARPAWYQPQQRPAENYDYGENRFIWPVQGRVLAEFGARQGGERNDGINIEASYGTPIYAASDGTVSYSGNELRNYGNLMLVRHDSGFVTAYAHADHFVVGKSERVRRGQIIGYVGKTGDVSSPQLHFELRKGTRGEQPVNPRLFLGPLQVAQR